MGAEKSAPFFYFFIAFLFYFFLYYSILVVESKKQKGEIKWKNLALIIFTLFVKVDFYL